MLLHLHGPICQYWSSRPWICCFIPSARGPVPHHTVIRSKYGQIYIQVCVMNTILMFGLSSHSKITFGWELIVFHPISPYRMNNSILYPKQPKENHSGSTTNDTSKCAYYDSKNEGLSNWATNWWKCTRRNEDAHPHEAITYVMAICARVEGNVIIHLCYI